MKSASNSAVRVNVRIDILDAATGRLRRRHECHNLVVDLGLAALASAMVGFSAEITHFAMGSGTTAPAASDVALVNEIDREFITSISRVDNVATAQYYLGSSMLNGSTIREAGIFIDTDLFARIVFNEPDLQPKTNVVAAIFSWDITFEAA